MLRNGSPPSSGSSLSGANTSGAPLSNLSAQISSSNPVIALGGGQAATQYIGALGPGASIVLFWYFVYPSAFNITSVLSVAVTDNTAGASTGTARVRTTAMISSQGGGRVLGQTLSPGSVPGQYVDMDIQYEFSQVDDPPSSINMQPVGNTDFNAGCFQLTSSVILSSQVNAIPAGAQNQLYFKPSVAQSGTKFTVYMRYRFRYLCFASGSIARPLYR